MLPAYLTRDYFYAFIDRAIAEDVGSGDVTTEATIPADQEAEGYVLVKEDGVVAGLEAGSEIFSRLDPKIDLSWSTGDGARVTKGTRIGTISGPARSLLIGERLALNLIQRMSGIATKTRRMVDAIGEANTRLLDTRKTAPGMRALDKWAVLLGGGRNHRVGLYDMILIKDNHIAACGGVREAILAARSFCDRQNREDLKIEIEARTLAEVDLVLETGGVDIVLLDNMVVRGPDAVDTSMLAEAVSRIDGRFLTEASGNVDLDTVRPIAETGVDFVSSGALTHSVSALDVSLKLSLA